MYECAYCGRPIEDGQNITKVEDGLVFNNGEVDYINTEYYHSEHVTTVEVSRTRTNQPHLPNSQELGE